MKVESARIDSLVHWNYWIIALFAAYFMLPTVLEGVKAFLKAITNGIFRVITDGVVSLFSQKNKKQL